MVSSNRRSRLNLSQALKLVMENGSVLENTAEDSDGSNLQVKSLFLLRKNLVTILMIVVMVWVCSMQPLMLTLTVMLTVSVI